MMQRNDGIVTLSSKVRNDRGMDSRFHGNFIEGAGMTGGRNTLIKYFDNKKKDNKRRRSENIIFFYNFITSYNISYVK